MPIAINFTNTEFKQQQLIATTKVKWDLLKYNKLNLLKKKPQEKL